MIVGVPQHSDIELNQYFQLLPSQLGEKMRLRMGGNLALLKCGVRVLLVFLQKMYRMFGCQNED